MGLTCPTLCCGWLGAWGHLVSFLEKTAGRAALGRAALGRASPLPSLGHIQIAQVPGRHEPDSPGELNFPYIFKLLESLGYTGYVGCEYAPKGAWACRQFDPTGRSKCGPAVWVPCKDRQVLSINPYLGTAALAEQKLLQFAWGCQQEASSLIAGDTLEGLGWLRSYWESRGLQHGGTSKAAE